MPDPNRAAILHASGQGHQVDVTRSHLGVSLTVRVKGRSAALFAANLDDSDNAAVLRELAEQLDI